MEVDMMICRLEGDEKGDVVMRMVKVRENPSEKCEFRLNLRMEECRFEDAPD